MILCVGSTGHLGGAIVRELVHRNLPVRCLVREGSDQSKLPSGGVEVKSGDVRDATSIKAALQGVETVISSFATNIVKERGVDALWKNDYEGNLSLIRLSRDAGVKKFIFVSYWGLAKFGDFEHGKIKKVVEDLLSVSGIDYTVFRVTTLATDMSLLLGKTLREKGRAPLFMKKHEKIRPILPEDLAWCIADSISNPRCRCRTLEVAGEEEYSFIQFERLFCEALGKRVRFIFVPLPIASFVAGCIDFATANKYNARGLLSAFTGGSTCDISQMQSVFGIRQGSFALHLRDYFRTGAIVVQKPQGRQL